MLDATEQTTTPPQTLSFQTPLYPAPNPTYTGPMSPYYVRWSKLLKGGYIGDYYIGVIKGDTIEYSSYSMPCITDRHLTVRPDRNLKVFPGFGPSP